MDNGHNSRSNWIVPTVLTTSAFISLLFRLLSIDRPEITEAYFQSFSVSDLERVLAEFFLDNRNFRNVRRQIHENLALTTLGSQFPFELYLQPVLCIGTGTHVTEIYSQPRGTLIAECDVSIDCNPSLSPHCCGNAWQILSLPFNAFGCIFFAHAGNHPPFDNKVDLEQSLTTYYCALLPDGIFIYNSVVFEFEIAPELLATRHGYSTFEKWKKQWVSVFSKIGFVDIEILIKREPNFLPNAVSILLVARKEY